MADTDVTNSDEGAGHLVRIAKYLASAGLGSRRRCEELVVAGRVLVNGQPVTELGTKVDPATDAVFCDDLEVVPQRLHYLVLNKPRGYTCSARDAHARKLVGELLPKQLGRLFTVGRLDRDSEGLLICTNDGDFAQRVAHPSYEIPKRYRVWVRGKVHTSQLRGLEHGIMDTGETLTALCARIVKRRPAETELEFVIGEGKKREIRRMCAKFSWRVSRLCRVQIGPLKLGQLTAGQWRPMAAEERRALLDMAASDLQPPTSSPLSPDLFNNHEEHEV